MTAQEKVLKIYPNAYLWDMAVIAEEQKIPNVWYVDVDESIGSPELGQGKTELEAWEAAAERLPDLIKVNHGLARFKL